MLWKNEHPLVPAHLVGLHTTLIRSISDNRSSQPQRGQRHNRQVPRGGMCNYTAKSILPNHPIFTILPYASGPKILLIFVAARRVTSALPELLRAKAHPRTSPSIAHLPHHINYFSAFPASDARLTVIDFDNHQLGIILKFQSSLPKHQSTQRVADSPTPLCTPAWPPQCSTCPMRGL
mgnify:CR=1 FL=1